MWNGLKIVKKRQNYQMYKKKIVKRPGFNINSANYDIPKVFKAIKKLPKDQGENFFHVAEMPQNLMRYGL